MTINVHTTKTTKAAILYGITSASSANIIATGSQSVGVKSREKSRLF
jgi:hypothetical protein